MKPFTKVRGIAAPLAGRNIDTDQIIPARFLKKNRASGYENYLFHDLRVEQITQQPKDFVLNQMPFKNASILIAEHNFGCGSSREAAVYALADFGFRAILAPSFGDIFYSNCLKNGLLPIRIEDMHLDAMRERLLASQYASDSVNATEIEIDLQACTINDLSLGAPLSFEIDPFWRECLLKGVDEVALTMSYQDDIATFEVQHLKNNPWLRA
jgi:3-isopropylmalate/(R)-2-methylmalate dehydratase small subunit